MKTFKIIDREAGNLIDYGFTSYESAYEKIKEFEKSDKEEGIFTEDFYEVCEDEEIDKIKRFFTFNEVVKKTVSIKKIEEIAEIPKQSLYNFIRGKKYCNLTEENIKKLIPILQKIGYN